MELRQLARMTSKLRRTNWVSRRPCSSSTSKARTCRSLLEIGTTWLTKWALWTKAAVSSLISPLSLNSNRLREIHPSLLISMESLRLASRNSKSGRIDPLGTNQRSRKAGWCRRRGENGLSRRHLLRQAKSHSFKPRLLRLLSAKISVDPVSSTQQTKTQGSTRRILQKWEWRSIDLSRLTTLMQCKTRHPTPKPPEQTSLSLASSLLKLQCTLKFKTSNKSTILGTRNRIKTATSQLKMQKIKRIATFSRHAPIRHLTKACNFTPKSRHFSFVKQRSCVRGINWPIWACEGQKHCGRTWKERHQPPRQPVLTQIRSEKEEKILLSTSFELRFSQLHSSLIHQSQDMLKNWPWAILSTSLAQGLNYRGVMSHRLQWINQDIKEDVRSAVRIRQSASKVSHVSQPAF